MKLKAQSLVESFFINSMRYRYYTTHIFVILCFCMFIASCSSLSQNNTADLAELPSHYNQIALLLPLHGPYKGPGRAVRDGFLAAYYAALRQGQISSTITIVDTTTTSNNIRMLYSKTASEGAELIIGPLVKSNVQALATSKHIDIPTITLNYADSNTTSPKRLFQFGILPQNEARQVAAKARSAGFNKVIVIAPQNTWGKAIVTAFTNEWQRNGGVIVDQLEYSSDINLRPAIKTLLKVNESMSRGKNLQDVLGEKVKFVPQRRLDFECIFLVAEPPFARQIVPLLNFYYAGNVPIYSTSMIYNGVPNLTYDRDMDKVIFDEIPWMFSQNAGDVRTQHGRLYALGLDAFTLVQNLKQLSGNPAFGMNASTGKIYLGPNHQILQEYSWAQFKNGRVQEIR